MIFRVLFEDNHVLALSKPAGLLTQPTKEEPESLQGLAKEWLKEKYKKPGNVYLEPIHRLDKSASGIVIFAKTSKALSRLVEAMRQKATKKIYWAVVETVPQEPEGDLHHALLHGDHVARVVSSNTPGAKMAHLHYKTLKSAPERALLEIELFTGRYHQIRIQLASIGCPILGDLKYGSKKRWKKAGIALHHTHFEIMHPITKETLVIDDPAPKDF